MINKPSTAEGTETGALTGHGLRLRLGAIQPVADGPGRAASGRACLSGQVDSYLMGGVTLGSSPAQLSTAERVYYARVVA